MNHQPKEHYHTNQVAIAHNTRSKRRVVEDVAFPSSNQASTLDATPHVPVVNDQSNMTPQKK